MDAAKLDHINLLGAKLLWLSQHLHVSSSSDIVSLKPSDVEPPPRTARETAVAPGASHTPDTGFVTQGWASQGTQTASSWSGLPVMSPRINPPMAASSEPVLPPHGGRLQYEQAQTISSLQQTVAELSVRIAALEQKLGDPDELIARCVMVPFQFLFVSELVGNRFVAKNGGGGERAGDPELEEDDDDVKVTGDIRGAGSRRDDVPTPCGFDSGDAYILSER